MASDTFTLPEISHPVVEVLRERAASGSAPGARSDPHRVALVIEGGGMRGVVSAGMTAALERLGLTACFDLVVGASAGAINGAALIAGVAREGAATYHGPLASRSFVNPARVLRGRPVIDVNYVLNYASAGLDEGRHDRAVASPIALHCVAVAVETAQPAVFSGMRTKRELWDALLASSRMPWAGGAPSRSAAVAISTAASAPRSRSRRPWRPGRPTCSRSRPGRMACRARAPHASATG